MNSTLVWLTVLGITLVLGVIIGFTSGLNKGMKLGQNFGNQRPPSPLPPMICATIAALLLLGATGTAIYSLYFLSNSAQTTATVTHFIERKDEEGNTSYSTAYYYSTSAEETFEDRSMLGDAEDYQVGDEITVRYLIKSPHRSKIDRFVNHWGLPLTLTAFGVLLGITAIFLKWWRKKEQHWANQHMAKTQ
ncbi:DUF3592 domain-containing protein [Akkermansiaceae bacterium]|nr:DUF3592 domain-containing protein [Akkermansiaceae bacterium]